MNVSLSPPLPYLVPLICQTSSGAESRKFTHFLRVKLTAHSTRTPIVTRIVAIDLEWWFIFSVSFFVSLPLFRSFAHLLISTRSKKLVSSESLSSPHFLVSKSSTLSVVSREYIAKCKCNFDQYKRWIW